MRSTAPGAIRQYRSRSRRLSNRSATRSGGKGRMREVSMAAPKMFDLSGKVAIVTGGNGGIGRGIALGLAEAGASVAILARNEEKNRATLADLEKLGVPACAIKLDVTRRDELAAAMAQAEKKLGAVDILVNNAGIAVNRPALKYEAQDWDRVIETNLNSCFFLSQIAARTMASRKRGKIINIASEYSRFGGAGLISYATAKGGLVQMTKTLAVELARHNVQVNAIVPGWIKTDMTMPAQSGPFFDEIILRTPAGRFGEPEEMAGTAVFLASHASDFVTGAIVYVDGGFAIR
jgi:2-deoxy-D-gluconate 3-dehydrogenase